MAVELPNLFDYATSELTQDGFFAYFFKWAEDKDNNEDKALHDCAKKALEKFYGTMFLENIKSIDIEKQWNHIDLLITINEKYKLIIEDKIDTGVHNNQLSNYRELLKDDSNAEFVYLKTGEISKKDKEAAESDKYKIIDIYTLSQLFVNCTSKDTIFQNYKAYINKVVFAGRLRDSFLSKKEYKCGIYKKMCLYFWFNTKENKSKTGAYLALDVWCSLHSLYFALHCKGTGKDKNWMMDGKEVKRTIEELTALEQNDIEKCNFVFKENYYEYISKYSDFDDAVNKIREKIVWIQENFKNNRS